VGYRFFLIAGMEAEERAAEPFRWTIAASKAVYYPGEPVALTITIQNAGSRDEEVFLGALGVGAFSFDLFDNAGRVISQGGRIEGEEGAFAGRSIFLSVPAGQAVKTPVVLNRWCSTLLPPGEYRVICHADYKLKSEAIPEPNSPKTFRLTVVHKAEMPLLIRIVKADPLKYQEILGDIEKAIKEERRPGETPLEQYRSHQFAGELLAFCEWPEAVPYQLRAVNVRNDPWLTRCSIRSLGRSKSLEAANGLMSLVDDPSLLSFRFEIIRAIHALHASGKPDILRATEAFVKQHSLSGPPIEDKGGLNH
jgi:hypothetical protein